MKLRHASTVDFDANNPEHRQSVKNFLKRKHWGDTDLRFNHNSSYISIDRQVQETLLKWYLDRE